MTINYGIISTAQVVPRFIAGIRESRNGRVAAVASRDLPKATAFAKEHEIPKAYGTYQELYQDEEIDIVYIATYNKGHYEAAKEALTAGKNVLLEKPFTLKYDEAAELFQLAEAKGLFLMEAQKAAFLPITLKVKELLAAGKLGEIKRIESVTAYPNIDHVKWFHDLSAGGGSMHGAGTYPLEYLQLLFGEGITEYFGIADLSKEGSDVQSNLLLKFGKGLLADIFITTELDRPSGMTIYGKEGKLEIPDFWKTKEALLTTDSETERLFIDHQSEFVFEVDHVNECLEKGLTASPVMTKAITLQTVKIVEALYRRWFE